MRNNVKQTLKGQQKLKEQKDPAVPKAAMNLQYSRILDFLYQGSRLAPKDAQFHEEMKEGYQVLKNWIQFPPEVTK